MCLSVVVVLADASDGDVACSHRCAAPVLWAA